MQKIRGSSQMNRRGSFFVPAVFEMPCGKSKTARF